MSTKSSIEYGEFERKPIILHLYEEGLDGHTYLEDLEHGRCRLPSELVEPMKELIGKLGKNTIQERTKRFKKKIMGAKK